MQQIFKRIKRILQAEKNSKESYSSFDTNDDDLQKIIDELNSDNQADTSGNSHQKTNENSQKFSQNGHADPELIKAYKILGIDVNTADEDVRKAYIKLIKENHPDKVQNLSVDLQALAEKKTKEINKAYEYIESKRNYK